ncbi:uncharacterized protein LOC129617132 [Condylostylus longicornis]|uniref:uncharacterized protein LOC129617132 n=1 Tax=Condylostylus longicornis TaxID=2530218 RepID=UPI00244DC4E8|nr:uncharacterized protein LOC129617132 [Condylostylus longicornis]
MQPGQQFLDQSAKKSDETYRAVLGALNFLAGGTRPDISFAVHLLQTFQEVYTQEHWSAAMRILSYLNRTSDLCLLYRRSSTPTDIVTFCDASCSDSKSFSGYVVYFGGNLVSWRSKKQRMVANSTGFAELVALEDAVTQTVWLSNFRQEIFKESKDHQQTLVLTDSTAALQASHQSAHHSRMKTILNKAASIRQQEELGLVSFNFHIFHLLTTSPISSPKPCLRQLSKATIAAM